MVGGQTRRDRATGGGRQRGDSGDILTYRDRAQDGPTVFGPRRLRGPGVHQGWTSREYDGRGR